MRIPLSAPDITDAEIDAVAAVLRSSQLSLGPALGAFEQAFADYLGVPDAIAVSSGTAGLHLCVRALGLGAQDEVLVPSFTFIAAANAIRYEGATPVFVDIEADTLNMDPDAVERAITPRTRAIMAVHTFGRPASMDRLLALAEQHNLRVIEDACESIGAMHQGRMTGTLGHAGVFAFYPNKQMTTGEGGMIVTHDSTLAGKLRALRNQGRYASDNWLQHEEFGYNYRLSELACALGIEQLKRLPAMLARREAVARLYDAHLGDVAGLELPSLTAPHATISWFVYVVRLTPACATSRDAVLAYLQARGIGCARYFAPLHLQPCYQDQPLRNALPVTEQQATRTLALPFFNRITEDEVGQVASALRTAMACSE